MFACRRTNETARLAPTAASFHVEVGSRPPGGPRGGEFCCSSAKQICRRIVLLASVQNKASSVFGLCWCAESRTARVDGGDGREQKRNHRQPQTILQATEVLCLLPLLFFLFSWVTFGGTVKLAVNLQFLSAPVVDHPVTGRLGYVNLSAIMEEKEKKAQGCTENIPVIFLVCSWGWVSQRQKHDLLGV